MVGTPAETVTPSDAMRPVSGSGAMNRWGIACLAPSMVAAKGSPQPIAWNIGTTAHAQSVALRPMVSVITSAIVCR